MIHSPEISNMMCNRDLEFDFFFLSSPSLSSSLQLELANVPPKLRGAVKFKLATAT